MESTARLVRLCTAGALLGVAAHVVGKAARDALFVATFPAQALPWVFLGTALASGVAVAIYGRLQARHAPRVVSPVLALVVAASLVPLWLWLRTGSVAAIALLYVWVTVAGALVISAFWALVSELFDVRSARKTIGRLTIASSVGGLLGAVATHWLVVPLGSRGLLVPLVGINLSIAFVLRRMAIVAPARSERPAEGRPLRAGISAVATDRYLGGIAGLVAVTGVAGTLGDFLLKSGAAAAIPDETSLTEFFATYHGVVGAVTLGVQLLLARPLLQRRGMAASLAVLPIVLFLGAAGLFVLPPIVAAVALRGGETSARNSFHRAAYELLFVPVRAEVKRVAKVVVDTFVERLADALGALLLIAIVALGWEQSAPGAVIAVLGVIAITLLPAIRRGYVASLTDNLVNHAGVLDADMSRVVESDATARHTLKLSLGEPISQKKRTAREIVAAGGTLVVGAPAVDASSAVIRALRSSDEETVKRALEAWDGDRRSLPFVVPLLARDELFEAVLDALSRHVDRHAGALADELCDGASPLELRKRIPRVLARTTSPRGLVGLDQALADESFSVRYHAARALRGLASRGVAIDEAPIWRALRRDVAEALPLWEAQRLIDEGVQEEDLPLHDVVKRRGAAGLRHVFNLLALVFDPEPVDLAYRALVGRDESLRGVALEYLEHVLPADLRAGLWPYVGDSLSAVAPVSRRAVHEVLAELRREGPAVP
jgi:ATP:ADP antiporter, AAA family